MTLDSFRHFSMLALGLSTVGIIATAPDMLPPAASGGLLLISFALIVSGLRRAGEPSPAERPRRPA